MFQYIEKLRAKPDSTKKQVAFIVAFVISGIIFVIWLSVIYPHWKEDQENIEKVSKVEPSPLAGFVDNITNGFSGIKEQYSNIKESMTFSATSTESDVSPSN